MLGLFLCHELAHYLLDHTVFRLLTGCANGYFTDHDYFFKTRSTLTIEDSVQTDFR